MNFPQKIKTNPVLFVLSIIFGVAVITIPGTMKVANLLVTERIETLKMDLKGKEDLISDQRIQIDSLNSQLKRNSDAIVEIEKYKTARDILENRIKEKDDLISSLQNQLNSSQKYYELTHKDAQNIISENNQSIKALKTENDDLKKENNYFRSKLESSTALAPTWINNNSAVNAVNGNVIISASSYEGSSFRNVVLFTIKSYGKTIAEEVLSVTESMIFEYNNRRYSLNYLEGDLIKNGDSEFSLVGKWKYKISVTQVN